MKAPVYIDSCAWNHLFDAQVVMREVFPPEEFRLFITREVEIELLEIPDDGKDGTDKRPLKRFVRESIEEHPIRTTSVFGFATFEPDGSPSKHQVNSGFNQGNFQPMADREWYDTPEVRAHLHGKSSRNSTLTHNQADASLGVRSFDAIVLTNEKRNKLGPIHLAAQQSGHVHYLRDLAASGLTLKAFMQAARQRWMQTHS